MQVTAHFAAHEFRQRARHGFGEVAYPQRWIKGRLHPLCETLEMVRAMCRRPITILSGYRSPEYNRAIKGARRSQHVEGRAADITVEGLSPADVHSRILGCYQAGMLPRLGGLGLYPPDPEDPVKRPGFVHVDVRPTPSLVRWTGSRVES